MQLGKKMPEEITRVGVLDMQVCVPVEWTDAQVLTFAEQENPCGTRTGWSVRRQGDEALAGDSERVPCSEKNGHVHIMVEA